MSAEPQLRVLAVAGSLNPKSATRSVVDHVVQGLRRAGCEAELVDLASEPLLLFDPEKAWTTPGYLALKPRVEAADVFLLGTPDYHGSISGGMKNFLDHFWREFAGKLFATIVASHEKGLTVTDQLRTVARQCYAWAMPYGIAFEDRHDLKDGQVANEAFGKRLEMFTRDVRIYGGLLAAQRRADLAGTDPGFLARLRR
jgi:FMN reductase